MIRIRAIHSAAMPAARRRIDQAAAIFRQNFPALADYADRMEGLLADPMRHGYRTILLVLETTSGRVDAFALMMDFPAEGYAFLDFLAVRRGVRGGGLGTALYEAVRERARAMQARGLFMEVEPDEPALTPGAEALAEARRRLRFYEHYGVRPVLNEAYAAPIGDPPTTAYLLFDGLGEDRRLPRDEARAAVRQILTKRFARSVDRAYVEGVLAGFRDDPVRLRPPRYVRAADKSAVASGRLERAFSLTASTRHTIHHVHERGYFERPARVGAILEALEPTGLFTSLAPRPFGEAPVRAVHDRAFVDYLKAICLKLKPGRPVYPDTFPIRRPDRRPRMLPEQAGYYCIDSCTPLDSNAWAAARASVDVALTGAEEVLAGRPVAYALCRPPGHHAERRVYGGFCYFNNAAIAAHRLAREVRAAVLDVDYHHGNGTQDIFYARDDVLTLSIHGHPDHAFPYFSGFRDETGEGPGVGFNHNFPLKPGTKDEAYLEALGRALGAVERFQPGVLVVSLGFDTLRGDPTGLFELTPRALESMGERLGAIGVPLLVVQEGGYDLRSLRRGSAAFFAGLARQIAARDA